MRCSGTRVRSFYLLRHLRLRMFKTFKIFKHLTSHHPTTPVVNRTTVRTWKYA